MIRVPGGFNPIWRILLQDNFQALQLRENLSKTPFFKRSLICLNLFYAIRHTIIKSPNTSCNVFYEPQTVAIGLCHPNETIVDYWEKLDIVDPRTDRDYKTLDYIRDQAVLNNDPRAFRVSQNLNFIFTVRTNTFLYPSLSSALLDNWKVL